ncbi:MAG: hypothetical protein AABX39_05395 [Nanoarchaeota archaeon]
MTDKYEQPQSNYTADGGSNAKPAYPDLDGLVSDAHKKYEPLIRGLGPVENILFPQSMSAMQEDYQKILYAGIAYHLAQLKDQTALKPEYGKATSMVLDALINMYLDKAGLSQYLGQSSKDNATPVYREKDKVPNGTSR